MCGILGFLNKSKKFKKYEYEIMIKKMLDSIYHRGPDGFGIWSNTQGNVFLGHRRLSIIDLSSNGKQPMTSETGRFTITFNGEIYNFDEIRKEILKVNNYRFKSNTDTEVILAACETWGILESLKKFVGMFAIALFDNEENCLYLIRDRLGEKPLYYGWQGDSFIFASELKAFREHVDFKGEIDRDVLSLYFKYNYIPSPFSIYKHIYKLLPASVFKMDLTTYEHKIFKYWDIDTTNKFDTSYSDEELIQQLEKLILQSVRRQMLSSDVPIGAFLSGGVDSSTIVALMQSLSDKPINTFSIGFFEKDYNEANFAKDVAKYLGTNHTELYVEPHKTYDIIQKIATYYDEPFADSSQVPTFLVSQLAKKYVTVVLSGDGGDELFGGYTRYLLINNFWKKINYIPLSLRKVMSKTINLVENFEIQKFLDSSIQKKMYQIFRGANLLTIKYPEDLYNHFISSWNPSNEIVLGSKPLDAFITSAEGRSLARNLSFYEWMMFVDLNMYLPDDILVKVDRASMAVSLETRVPLLDHNVVEFAWKLPFNQKVRGNISKWILKQIMYKYLPKELMDRPKKGFGVPVGQWIKGPLREWAEDLLNEKTLKEQGFLNTKIVKEKWEEHLLGIRNLQPQLWSILMFQSWLKENQ